MKKGVYILMLILLMSFVIGAEGDSCFTDDDCDVNLYCYSNTCMSLGDIDTSCLSNSDCDYGYACSSNNYECVLIEYVATAVCYDISECKSGEECLDGYCIESVSINAGITSGPLGFMEKASDSVLGATLFRSNENFQSKLALEGLAESKSIDQRKAQGFMSDKSYANSKLGALERSAAAVNRLAQKENLGESTNQKLNSISGKMQSQYQNLENTNFQSAAGDRFSNVGMQISGARKNVGLASLNTERKILDCVSVTESTTVGSTNVYINTDGSITLSGSRGDYSIYTDGYGIEFVGESIIAYATEETYTGSDVLIYPGTMGNDLYVDSTVVGSVDMNLYGTPLLALGGDVVFTNENGKLLIGKDLMVTFSTGVLDICQLNFVGTTTEAFGEEGMQQGLAGQQQGMQQGLAEQQQGIYQTGTNQVSGTTSSRDRTNQQLGTNTQLRTGTQTGTNQQLGTNTQLRTGTQTGTNQQLGTNTQLRTGTQTGTNQQLGTNTQLRTGT